MITLQDKFNELKEKDSELICWFSNIINMQHDWVCVIRTSAMLSRVKPRKEAVETVDKLGEKLYKEWKKQESMFLKELNKKIKISKMNLQIQGNTEFSMLEFSFQYSNGDLVIKYNPIIANVSHWTSRLSDVVVL